MDRFRQGARRVLHAPLAIWLALFALATLAVGGLVILTHSSNVWLALLIPAIPVAVIRKPSRAYLPLTALLSGTYWMVNTVNHFDSPDAGARNALAITLTILFVSEVLYRNGKARQTAETALVATNDQLAQAVVRANEMAAIAQEADQIKSDFLASSSHELRTPLTGIISSLDLVLSGHCQDAAEERHFIQIARDSSEKLLGVVNAVVDIARLDAGKVEVELGPVYVAAIIGEVRDLLRVSAADRGLRLEVRGPIESLPLAWADSDKVRQILLNLVGNAIKFTERGDVVIGVEPDLAREQLHIAVRDTGIGIAVEKQGRLFQPFVQADREVARRFGGTGLGLSISRRLAERMGGSVTLYSAGEGQGSTFTLTLPLAPIDVASRI